MKMTQADLAEWKKLCEEHTAALAALNQEVGGLISEGTMHRWEDIMRRMAEFMKSHPVS